MKNIFLMSIILIVSCNLQAQNTLTKLKFEEAEKAFYDADYENCIKLLDETEKLLGQPAPKILHLKIIAENKIWEANPYASYEQLERLRSLCNQYMQNYDIQGLEDKFKEVYEISTTLPNASNQVELTQLKNKYEKETKAEQLEKTITENNLVFVEGGTFMMGEGKDSHEVTLSDFYIGKFEITEKMYSQSLSSKNSESSYPKVISSYKDALQYCKWLENKYGGTWRLPTEAEWEFAARGGNKSKDYKYSGSDDFEEVGWYISDYSSSLYETGQKKPNELGIYDMTGNARELCNDWYAKFSFSEGQNHNPMGPDSGDGKVVRDIGFNSFGSGSSLYNRKKVKESDPSKKFNHYEFYLISFRVVWIPDKD